MINIDVLYSKNFEFVSKNKIVDFDSIVLFQKKVDLLIKNFSMVSKKVLLKTNLNPTSTCMILALWKNNCVVTIIEPRQSEMDFAKIALVPFEFIIEIDSFEEITITPCTNNNNAPEKLIIEDLIKEKSPGLMLFTSGSTGNPKVVLHDVNRLLKKYLNKPRNFSTIITMDFDHIGGLDLVLRTIAGGGRIVVPMNRNPSTIIASIDKFQVQLLPGTASFFRNLLDNFEKEVELASLKFITVGAEYVSSGLLKNLSHQFPNVKVLQTYGSTELGTLKNTNFETGSPWISFDSTEVNFRIVEGMLEIKNDSSMIGYLNAPSPFTVDGWYRTGDFVEVVNQKIRVVGRVDERINVGGYKVSPTEIEEVIEKIPGVLSVLVFGVENYSLGQVIMAQVYVKGNVMIDSFEVRKFCSDHLASYKVPMKVEIFKGEPEFFRKKIRKIS